MATKLQRHIDVGIFGNLKLKWEVEDDVFVNAVGDTLRWPNAETFFRGVLKGQYDFHVVAIAWSTKRIQGRLEALRQRDVTETALQLCNTNACLV